MLKKVNNKQKRLNSKGRQQKIPKQNKITKIIQQ